MGEFDKPKGKRVPLVERIPIITNYGFAGKILHRPDIETVHLDNLKKYQERIKQQKFIYDFIDYPSYHYDYEMCIIEAIQLGRLILYKTSFLIILSE
ncbi:MAG: hypothetical protein NTZ83_01160 [Candidatus Pacearchaeota archaeon]|nr:hypothetical protein [Candidatus Pacearchaeota archaeon]